MRLLLDSHFVFWWQTGDPRLSKQIESVIRNADSVVVSHVTLWEFTIKQTLGRIHIDLPVFAAQVESMGFEWLPIGIDHMLQLAHVEIIDGHRDPFDRMLIAQSRATLRTLLTADTALERYGPLVRVM